MEAGCARLVGCLVFWVCVLGGVFFDPPSTMGCSLWSAGKLARKEFAENSAASPQIRRLGVGGKSAARFHHKWEFRVGGSDGCLDSVDLGIAHLLQ